MCLPWLRRLRAWRSLRRAVRVATRARGFEVMRKSVHAVRACPFTSNGASDGLSAAIAVDRCAGVATASVPSGNKVRALGRAESLPAGDDPHRGPKTFASVL
eukprot:1992728-Pleurochrysis_carterae.AAC.1